MTMLPFEPPLTPDGDEARRLAESELADPVYAAAQPTPLDRIAQAAGDLLDSLFGSAAPPGLGPALLVAAAVVIVGLVVVAFVVWGRPRSIRRESAPPGLLFDDDDGRDAAALRRDAAAAAARAEHGSASILRFRAIARGLQERGVVDLPPGATVHAFARGAATAFPAHGERLDAAADEFDAVRYLGSPGSAEGYERIAALDDDLAAARPARAEGAGAR
ncbi:DUF4129 domain-containing protein [Microbacterium limosum]|uniref:DUF4129 domain-containing protein n=1 Tax=Microbacterium limosum TaxID=3079935 RepID=A0AAU0MED3_9MICO|nr:DUF4129 domain-containing protein [Microbacterium sp. Y20]WOQ68782.1 DUF4129 domain-containing protein [Microbacterium sp. Y20]